MHKIALLFHVIFKIHTIILTGNARLVSEWLRVGYTQGNMNSDNTLLAGRTIDYGPYGWLERFDPSYQPFTSDGEGKFSFLKQPTAMNVNVAVLGESIEVLIHAALQRDGITDPRIVSENIGRVRDLAHMEFERQFVPVYENMRRAKLGLSTTQSDDATLFSDLDKLLFK